MRGSVGRIVQVMDSCLRSRRVKGHGVTCSGCSLLLPVTQFNVSPQFFLSSLSPLSAASCRQTPQRHSCTSSPSCIPQKSPPFILRQPSLNQSVPPLSSHQALRPRVFSFTRAKHVLLLKNSCSCIQWQNKAGSKQTESGENWRAAQTASETNAVVTHRRISFDSPKQDDSLLAFKGTHVLSRCNNSSWIFVVHQNITELMKVNRFAPVFFSFSVFFIREACRAWCIRWRPSTNQGRFPIQTSRLLLLESRIVKMKQSSRLFWVSRLHVTITQRSAGGRVLTSAMETLSDVREWWWRAPPP